MTSKMDYLAKYLGTREQKAKKEEKKKKRRGEVDMMMIHDTSELLPAQKKTLEENLGPDVAVVRSEDTVVRTPADTQTSGVQWQSVSSASSGSAFQPRRVPLRRTVAVAQGGSDDDLSPPRQAKARVQSTPAFGSDDDLSPPRQAKPMARHDSDDNLSPPRQPQVAVPRHDSDDDLSPPRQPNAAALRRDSDSGLSPPRKAKPAPRHDSDDDLSPPRQPIATALRRDSYGDLSPPRKAKPGPRHDSDGDLSPPRTPKPGPRHDSDGDLSPPRTAKPTAPRHDSDGDMSPPRRRHGGGREAKVKKEPVSPRVKEEPRSPASAASQDLSPARRPAKSGSGGQKMSSGLSAGLQSAAALKEESAAIRKGREESSLATTSKSAETVYRDKSGCKIDREEWVKQQAPKKRRSDYPEQKLEWGTGLVQQKERGEEQEELAKLAQEPLARFEIDEEFDRELQEKDRWNDPMARFAQIEKMEDERTKKKHKKTEPAKPKCRFPGPPNRFKLQPGYRWDGKIRGNGFEDRWAKRQNQKRHDVTQQSMIEIRDW